MFAVRRHTCPTDATNPQPPPTRMRTWNHVFDSDCEHRNSLMECSTSAWSTLNVLPTETMLSKKFVWSRVHLEFRVIGVPHTMAETNVAVKDSCTCREKVNIPRCDRKQNLSVGHSRALPTCCFVLSLFWGLVGLLFLFIILFCCLLCVFWLLR